MVATSNGSSWGRGRSRSRSRGADCVPHAYSSGCQHKVQFRNKIPMPASAPASAPALLVALTTSSTHSATHLSLPLSLARAAHSISRRLTMPRIKLLRQCQKASLFMLACTARRQGRGAAAGEGRAHVQSQLASSAAKPRAIRNVLVMLH